MERARALTPDEVQPLLAKLKEDADDPDTYWTLVRHYEYSGNLKDLDALRLWYIEHQPGGKIWSGNINPRLDEAGYARGKALWLAHLERLGAAAEIYQRAADFLGRWRQAASRVGPADRPEGISKRHPVGIGLR